MPAIDDERLRRQVYKLTSADLAQFPAWEFALDEEDTPGQDEATVRPYLQTPADPGDGLMVVRSRFALADGSKLSGYCYPPPPTLSWNLQSLQPVIVVDHEQIPLWFGMFPPPMAEFHRLLGVLGKTMDQVFPLTYGSDIELVGAPVQGTVKGFSFLKDEEVTTI